MSDEPQNPDADEVVATSEGTDTTAELVSAFDSFWATSDEDDDDDAVSESVGPEEDESEAGSELADALAGDETEEDDGDLPATSKHTGIKQLREAYKTQKAEAAELRRQMAELKASQELASAQSKAEEKKPAKGASQELADKYSTEEILTFLGRYENGEIEGDEKSLAKLRGEALEALELKTPQEVLEVKKKAQRGEYGTVSRDVEAVAAEALATLQVVGESRRAQAQRATQWQTERENSFKQALKEAGVALRADGQIDDSTPEGKAFIEAGKEILEAVPSLVNDAKAPLIVSHYAQLKSKAASYDAIAKENAELKARLKRFGGALPAGAKGAAKKSSGNTARDELAAAFREAGLEV